MTTDPHMFLVELINRVEPIGCTELDCSKWQHDRIDFIFYPLYACPSCIWTSWLIYLLFEDFQRITIGRFLVG